MSKVLEWNYLNAKKQINIEINALFVSCRNANANFFMLSPHVGGAPIYDDTVGEGKDWHRQGK